MMIGHFFYTGVSLYTRSGYSLIDVLRFKGKVREGKGRILG